MFRDQPGDAANRRTSLRPVIFFKFFFALYQFIYR